MNNPKEKITQIMTDYICQYRQKSGTPMNWKTPLVGFANAKDPEFAKLKVLVHPGHALPLDLLPEAVTVVSYFLPYPESIILSNRAPKGFASSQWAMAYRETNTLFKKLNDYMIQALSPAKVALPLGFAAYDQETITSCWSQRHIAHIAGLGTFGENNMLISEKGCGGRYSSFVTDLDAPADPLCKEEACLYKRNGSCRLCMQRCPSHALREDGFQRKICAAVCNANQEFHDPHMAFGVDSAVCGKCLIDLPCTFQRPK